MEAIRTPARPASLSAAVTLLLGGWVHVVGDPFFG
jgi:hypothetical protein